MRDTSKSPQNEAELLPVEKKRKSLMDIKIKTEFDIAARYYKKLFKNEPVELFVSEPSQHAIHRENIEDRTKNSCASPLPPMSSSDSLVNDLKGINSKSFIDSKAMFLKNKNNLSSMKKNCCSGGNNNAALSTCNVIGINDAMRREILQNAEKEAVNESSPSLHCIDLPCINSSKQIKVLMIENSYVKLCKMPVRNISEVKNLKSLSYSLNSSGSESFDHANAVGNSTDKCRRNISSNPFSPNDLQKTVDESRSAFDLNENNNDTDDFPETSAQCKKEASNNSSGLFNHSRIEPSDELKFHSNSSVETSSKVGKSNEKSTRDKAEPMAVKKMPKPLMTIEIETEFNMAARYYKELFKETAVDSFVHQTSQNIDASKVDITNIPSLYPNHIAKIPSCGGDVHNLKGLNHSTSITHEQRRNRSNWNEIDCSGSGKSDNISQFKKGKEEATKQEAYQNAEEAAVKTNPSSFQSVNNADNSKLRQIKKNKDQNSFIMANINSCKSLPKSSINAISLSRCSKMPLGDLVGANKNKICCEIENMPANLQNCLEIEGSSPSKLTDHSGMESFDCSGSLDLIATKESKSNSQYDRQDCSGMVASSGPLISCGITNNSELKLSGDIMNISRVEISDHNVASSKYKKPSNNLTDNGKLPSDLISKQTRSTINWSRLSLTYNELNPSAIDHVSEYNHHITGCMCSFPASCKEYSAVNSPPCLVKPSKLISLAQLLPTEDVPAGSLNLSASQEAPENNHSELNVDSFPAPSLEVVPSGQHTKLTDGCRLMTRFRFEPYKPPVLIVGKKECSHRTESSKNKTICAPISNKNIELATENMTGVKKEDHVSSNEFLSGDRSICQTNGQNSNNLRKDSTLLEKNTETNTKFSGEADRILDANQSSSEKNHSDENFVHTHRRSSNQGDAPNVNKADEVDCEFSVIIERKHEISFESFNNDQTQQSNENIIKIDNCSVNRASDINEVLLKAEVVDEAFPITYKTNPDLVCCPSRAGSNNSIGSAIVQASNTATDHISDISKIKFDFIEDGSLSPPGLAIKDAGNISDCSSFNQPPGILAPCGTGLKSDVVKAKEDFLSKDMDTSEQLFSNTGPDTRDLFLCRMEESKKCEVEENLFDLSLSPLHAPNDSLLRNCSSMLEDSDWDLICSTLDMDSQSNNESAIYKSNADTSSCNDQSSESSVNFFKRPLPAVKSCDINKESIDQKLITELSHSPMLLFPVSRETGLSTQELFHTQKSPAVEAIPNRNSEFLAFESKVDGILCTPKSSVSAQD